MAKKSIIDDLYIDFQTFYNEWRQDSTPEERTGNTMSDMGYFYVSKDLIDEYLKFFEKEDEFGEDSIEYDDTPNMNLILVTHWEKPIVNFYIFNQVSKAVDLRFLTSSCEGELLEKLDKLVERATGREEYLSYFLLDVFLYFLKKKETIMGQQEVRSRTKSGREVIIPLTYVSNKKYITKAKEDFPLVVDWKHSWNVIGHWRTKDGIGKNRLGEYVEVGKTWVNPCIKGDGELITKVKIIK